VEARQGRLVCEVCAQPGVVRAGEERFWRFAHRARANCPKAQDALEIVECRALLYGWLRTRFPDAIQLEKVLPGLPRPLDGLVDRPGQASLARWLIPAAVKPEVPLEEVRLPSPQRRVRPPR
jgi:competence CoiA-like predicted nuclease